MQVRSYLGTFTGIVSMQPGERLEAIEKVLEELRILNRDYPVIVEGLRDEQALRELGVGGRVIKVHEGKPISRRCEMLKGNKAIILTDWDSKGGELCKALKEYSKANDIEYDIGLRRKFARYCRKEVKDVESLPKCISNLKWKVFNRK